MLMDRRVIGVTYNCRHPDANSFLIILEYQYKISWLIRDKLQICQRVVSWFLNAFFATSW